MTCKFLFSLFICIILSNFFTSCKKKEHEVIYVVESVRVCVISYTNEFGKDVFDEQVYSNGSVNWKKEIHFNPDLFGSLRTLNLYVGVLGKYPAYAHAKIFVDKKLVKEGDFIITEKNKEVPNISIDYTIPL